MASSPVLFLFRAWRYKGKKPSLGVQVKRIVCAALVVLFAGGVCGAASPRVRTQIRPAAPPQAQPHGEPAQAAGRDQGREAMLQTIGLLAGQGLVLGHEALAGVYGRYEKRLLTREQAERAASDQMRYAEWVMTAFKDRLMRQLTEQERKDLGLLIGFYDVERQAAQALVAYVKDGGSKNREAFEAAQERVAAIIRQISLGATP